VPQNLNYIEPHNFEQIFMKWKGGAVNIWAKNLLNKCPLHKKPHWTDERCIFDRQWQRRTYY